MKKIPLTPQVEKILRTVQEQEILRYYEVSDDRDFERHKVDWLVRLGLLTKRRRGVHSHYRITEKGRKALEDGEQPRDRTQVAISEIAQPCEKCGQTSNRLTYYKKQMLCYICLCGDWFETNELLYTSNAAWMQDGI